MLPSQSNGTAFLCQWLVTCQYCNMTSVFLMEANASGYDSPSGSVPYLQKDYIKVLRFYLLLFLRWFLHRHKLNFYLLSYFSWSYFYFWIPGYQDHAFAFSGMLRLSVELLVYNQVLVLLWINSAKIKLAACIFKPKLGSCKCRRPCIGTEHAGCRCTMLGWSK